MGIVSASFEARVQTISPLAYQSELPRDTEVTTNMLQINFDSVRLLHLASSSRARRSSSALLAASCRRRASSASRWAWSAACRSASRLNLSSCDKKHTFRRRSNLRLLL